METGTQTRVMGILNITPDSFSDGGLLFDREAVVAHVGNMIAAGVDILDVGGESTRPFAEPVSVEEEIGRVVPVIQLIREMSGLPVSIDTRKAAVAEAALAAGATMVNDISALRHDPAMLGVVRSYDGPVIIMHMQGTPETMQIQPHYDDVVGEITAFFHERTGWLEQNGISRKRIVIDPGIGFGKTVAHNLTILRNIRAFKQLGCPVLIGHSRKSFIGGVLGLDVGQRDCATAMLSLYCALNEADLVRVHDVVLSRQAVLLAQALKTAGS
ncbi:MAG: dihydropteroate synthase [Desulfobulbaceae bacterium]|jgi:dihydropteroate synthase|nr:dihydropteroate synthase [Desulfobulbaceae bacterium]MDY0351530.1 dihydropteroate synthase [Desulfobulbaceae bacterium]